MRYSQKIILYGWIFVAPALILFLIFKVVPIIVAMWVSFTEYNILLPPKFVGIRNYLWICRSSEFINSLGVTLYYASVSTIIILPLSLGIAIALNRKLNLQTFYRSVFFLPYMLSLFAVAIIWMQIYHPYGLMNSILSVLIPIKIKWLTTERYALPAIIIMRIWWGTGYYMILFLAGLQSIPNEYYEAARIDGANWWRAFLRITLPLLSPMLLFILVISSISAFQTIDVFLIMTKGGPVDATRVLALLTYETGLKFFRMGRGSAMSVILFLILMIFTIIQLKIFHKDTIY